MKARRELRTGLRLLVMALVFLAISCEDDGDGDGCLGDTDGLITGCSDGCGTDVWMIKGDGCLSDCIFDGDGCNLTGADGCGDCGGDGCGDCGSDAPYDYGDGKVVEGAVQIHVTNSLFAFVKDNLVDIIAAAAGDAMNVDQDGTITMCFPVGDDMCPRANEAVANCGGTGVAGCQLRIKLGEISVTPENNRDVRVRVNVADINGKLRTNEAGGCTISLKRKNGDFYVELRAQMNVNPQDKNTELYIGGGNDIGVKTNGLDLGLSGVLCWMGGAINVDNTIKGVIGGLPCRGCNNDSDCGGGGTCQNNICHDSSGRKCQGIQLGAQMGIDAGGLLQSIDPGAEAKLGILAFLGSYVETKNNGLQLAMRLGGKAEQRSLCVPERQPPIVDGKRDCRTGQFCDPIAELNNQGTVKFQREDGTEVTEPFHIGVGVAMGGLNQILHSVYNSGALCLSIAGDAGLDGIEMLATSLIGTFVESLTVVTQKQNQPLMIQLRPQYAPVVDFQKSGSNGAEILVKIPELSLDFYTIVDLRYQRIFTLTTDIELPLSISSKNNVMNIAIGSLKDLIDVEKTKVTNVEMISESEVKSLVKQLPTVIDAAAGSLIDGDMIPPIDLSELAGDALGGLELELVGPGVGIINEGNKPAALGVYLRMGLDTDAIDPLNPNGLRSALEPEITNLNIEMQNPRDLRADLAQMRRNGEVIPYEKLMPKIRVEMATTGAALSPDEVEYAYTINNGPWSYWEKGPVLNIDRPRLAIEGKYDVRITARRVGDGSSGSKHDAEFSFVNDFTAPTVELYAQDGQVRVRAKDNVYDVNELSMQYRVNGGAWSDRAPIHAIDVASYLADEEYAAVDVSVEDPSGNIRHARRTFGEKRAPVAQANDAADGCSSFNSQGGLLGVFALLGLVLLRRRESGRGAIAASSAYASLAILAILLLGMSAAGCKNKDKPGSSVCDPACSRSEICEAGQCVPITCEDDRDCAAGGTCVDGVCHNPQTCSDNDDCDYGHICKNGGCEPSECKTTADCQLSCPDGELPFCDYDDYESVEAGECVCSAGLEMRNHGEWLGVHELSNGDVIVLAYNSFYGDVILGTMQSDQTFVWEFLDGVPDGPVVMPPSGLRSGIRAVGDDAGRYISSVIERTANGDVLHAAYQYASDEDATTRLRYARGVKGAAGWNWTTIDLDDQAISGMFPSIVLIPSAPAEEGADATNAIAIIYATADVVIEVDGATENDPVTTQYFSLISTAYAATSEPTSKEDFTVLEDGFVQEESLLDCGGLCGNNAKCHAALNVCVPEARPCVPSCEDGESCVELDGEKVCAVATKGKTDFTVIPRGTGLFTSSVVDSTGVVHTAYYDQVHGNLWYVTFEVAGDGLQVKNAPMILDGEENGASTGDVGRWAHVQLSKDEEVVVFYENAGTAELWAARVNGNSVSRVLISDGIFIGKDDLEVANNRVGASVSAYALQDGGFEIYFQDSTDSVVRRVRWTDLNASPGDAVGVFGTAHGIARDPVPAHKDLDASERRISPFPGAYGFFAKALVSEDRVLIVNKVIDYNAKRADGSVIAGVIGDVDDNPDNGEDPDGGEDPDDGDDPEEP